MGTGVASSLICLLLIIDHNIYCGILHNVYSHWLLLFKQNILKLSVKNKEDKTKNHPQNLI